MLRYPVYSSRVACLMNSSSPVLCSDCKIWYKVSDHNNLFVWKSWMRLVLKTLVMAGLSTLVEDGIMTPWPCSRECGTLSSSCSSKDHLTEGVSHSCKVCVTHAALILRSFSFRDNHLTKIGCMSITGHMRYDVVIVDQKNICE